MMRDPRPATRDRRPATGEEVTGEEVTITVTAVDHEKRMMISEMKVNGKRECV